MAEETTVIVQAGNILQGTSDITPLNILFLHEKAMWAIHSFNDKIIIFQGN